MPMYDYRCPGCSHTFDVQMSFAEYDLHKDQPCPECGTVSARIVGNIAFNLPGDDWPSKNDRVSKQMAENRKKVGIRQRERYGEDAGVRLTPNVEGERTDSWRDAQKLAASKGKDATTYESMVQREKVA